MVDIKKVYIMRGSSAKDEILLVFNEKNADLGYTDDEIAEKIKASTAGTLRGWLHKLEKSGDLKRVKVKMGEGKPKYLYYLPKNEKKILGG